METASRVELVTKGGLTEVPSQYIQPPDARPILDDGAGDDTAIPTISLSSSDSAAIGRACRDWGAFHVVDHGVPIHLLDRIRSLGLSFFQDCPMEEKLRYACDSSSAASEGYGSRMLLGTKDDVVLDWRDYFDHHTFRIVIEDSYLSPEACSIWFNKEIDRKLPFQEKHVLQQGSILGNLEKIGVLKRYDKNVERRDDSVSAVVEFGAGRGYLTQMLADCYGVEKVYLVERKSYKLKADRSLRQKENLVLERMRIDIEDLNLNAVESLHGVPYVAVGKHLCGPATDLSIRCCLSSESPVLRGLAIATCCHHLCQWKSYINKEYISGLGMSKDEFHTMTWFTSWAVDDDHGSNLPEETDFLATDAKEEEVEDDSLSSVEEVVKKMKPMERAVLGSKCKQIIDAGRMKWVKQHGLDSKLVKYIPAGISPENTLLIAGKFTPSSI